MCVFSPSKPSIPAQTVVPPVTDTAEEDAGAERRLKLAKQQEAKRQSAAQTSIHTSTLGAEGMPMVRKKTLG